MLKFSSFNSDNISLLPQQSFAYIYGEIIGLGFEVVNISIAFEVLVQTKQTVFIIHLYSFHFKIYTTIKPKRILSTSFYQEKFYSNESVQKLFNEENVQIQKRLEPPHLIEPEKPKREKIPIKKNNLASTFKRPVSQVGRVKFSFAQQEKLTYKLNTTSKLEQQQTDQKTDEMDGKTPISQHSEPAIETESQKIVIAVPTSQYIVNKNRKKLEKNFKLQGITETTK
ncbi:Hypothetical_protein [Hexamita inflata]|uniref:Hypothetical_protein n=1 Tax=Hexamita inflata TaxID=28002 RepID=A0AA86NKH6_9EUKA|nr:Hypothetical protein HINF_LOCUS8482 [Hexamita inflata]